ncbi:MAG: septal ring lytic transglycosylase RlpA family protein [Caulobacteraceae bacterium]
MSGAARSAERNRPWAAEAALLALAGLNLAACANIPAPVAGVETQGKPSERYTGYRVGQPYQVRGVWYYPKEQPNYDEIGIASWYGEAFHNRYTADGEVFDMSLPSAAHATLPLPSLVEVTNLANGKTLVVRVNDRGPFVDGRIIDLSKDAATELGFVAAGVTKVRVRYVGRASDPGGMAARQVIAAAPKAPAAKTAPSRLVQLADTGAPKASADYDYSAAPKRPIPYSQLAQAQPARAVQTPAPTAAAASVPAQAPAYATTGALTLASQPLPDVDTLLAAGPPTRAMPAAPAAYELQAGTFATEDSARRFASGLTGGGLPEVQVVHDGAGVVYQVVVHGLASPTDAAAARNEAIALGATRAQIIGGS